MLASKMSSVPGTCTCNESADQQVGIRFFLIFPQSSAGFSQGSDFRPPSRARKSLEQYLFGTGTSTRVRYLYKYSTVPYLHLHTGACFKVPEREAA